MLAWSLFISIVAHLLLLVVSPVIFRFEVPGGGAATASDASARPFGLEAIVAIPSDNAPEFPAAEEQPEEPVVEDAGPPQQATDQPAQPGQAPPADAAPGGAAPGGSARDVLRPGYRDPRLYAPTNEFPELQQTEHERYMEHLRARLEAVNDSLTGAAGRNQRTSDWSITDRDGNRWGLSPDGLHLGGFTVPRELLPLPGPTGDNRTLEAERERLRMRDEIQRQEEAGERARTQDERIEAIRDEAQQSDPDGG
ncbi:MAG: hypothetical protein WD737_01330 [Gemmatimonadota bacterium]